MAIQQLIAFVAHYDPEFPGKIRGSNPDKIAELERLAGMRLPSTYHDYLTAMGDSMDWLQPAQARFDTDTLLQYYQAESWRAPNSYLKIGLGDNDPFFDIYLELDGSPEPRVVTLPRGPADDFERFKKSFRHAVAGSLEQYLGTAVYRTARWNKLPNAMRLAGNDTSASRLAGVDPVLTPLELKPFWFSNDWVQVFASHGAGAIATQFPGGVLAIDIAAETPEKLGELRQTLRQSFPLPHAFVLRGRAEI